MPITQLCAYCGRPFIADKPTRRYCSTACYHEATRKYPQFTCEHCGKVFKLPRGHDGRIRRFCSHACYLAAVAAPRVTKACPVCGKTYAVPASIAHRYTVCSLDCSTKKPIRHTCLNCGAEFYGKPRRLFCSFECYRKYKGETRLEARVRSCLDKLCFARGYVQELQVGRYSLDFAFPEAGVCLEIDGLYWHRDARKEERRDRYLAKMGWRVIHISDADICKCHDDDELVSLLKQKLSPHIAPLLATLTDPL